MKLIERYFIAVGTIAGTLAIMGIIYAAIHFIIKYW